MPVYPFICKSMDDELIPLERYRGQVLLIVNTASMCGFTPQYRGLEMLYRQYRTRGFEVLAFPCDQFFNQEFETDEKIQKFCLESYQVSFPLFSKIKVRGPEAEPLFQHLSQTAPGWFGLKTVKWNFTKFLVNRRGRCVRRFATTTYPSQLRKHIEQLL